MTRTETPTEILAQKLFGWEPCEAPDGEAHRGYRWYEQFVQDGIYNIVGLDDKYVWWGRAHWPDFTDEIKQHYWKTKMEEKLFLMGPEYCDKYLTYLKEARYGKAVISDFNSGLMMMCAKTEERLAAAVRVAEEEGL